MLLLGKHFCVKCEAEAEYFEASHRVSCEQPGCGYSREIEVLDKPEEV